jgi:hypothetical protein
MLWPYNGEEEIREALPEEYLDETSVRDRYSHSRGETRDTIEDARSTQKMD